jgi:hypothetical protein
MSRVVRGLSLLGAAALAASFVAPALAQSLPPAPVPVTSQPAVTPGPAAPPPMTPPPPPEFNPPPPAYHEPLPNHDALLEPPSAASGWFGAVEIGILKPHVTGQLSGNVFFSDGSHDPVQLPNASLDWTVAPRFELGYRMAEGCGEFALSYRYLASDGRGDLPQFDQFADNPDGFLRSRLSLDVFDFDYGGPEISLGRNVDLKWRAGVRLADVFFDSRAFGDVTEQRSSNQFIGAGPHAAIDVWYHFHQFGLGVFARVEGALPIGRVRQGFEETFVFNDGSAFGSATTQSGTRVVPTVNAQLGLGWAPPGTRLRLSAGYEYEQWWSLGHVGGSHAGLFDQGAFLRAEFGF